MPARPQIPPVILKARKDHNNKLVFDEPRMLERILRQLPETFEAILRPEKKIRSLNQNAYYWGVVLKLIADHTGELETDLHEAFKEMFLPKGTILLGGVERIVSRSTSHLSTVEMEEYLAKIRAFASLELKCFIPEPNEVLLD